SVRPVNLSTTWKKETAFCQNARGVPHGCRFGVLQAQYAIIRQPGRFWKHQDLCWIMKTAIIPHNMTIEDEAGSESADDFNYHQTCKV
ncbi:hypothetical protein, partial [Salmonella sp. s59443]|uniref:hypothetical protein n=1 Tax=Salmonella sp. s59443 TaxID=3159717 RepID=UPI003980A4E6